jgi:hypothetical protein
MRERVNVLAAFWLGLLVGIPYWWYTTLVYRAELPHEHIQELLTKQVLNTSVTLESIFTFFL